MPKAVQCVTSLHVTELSRVSVRLVSVSCELQTPDTSTAARPCDGVEEPAVPTATQLFASLHHNEFTDAHVSPSGNAIFVAAPKLPDEKVVEKMADPPAF